MKLRPVGMQRHQLDPSSQERPLAGRQVSSKTLGVVPAKALRDDEVGDLLAEHRLAQVAEGLLGRRIEFDDAAARIDRDDRVERREDDGRFTLFALGEPHLDALALGDVHHHAGQPDDRAGCIAQGLQKDLDEAGAVRRRYRDLGAPGLPVLHCRAREGEFADLSVGEQLLGCPADDLILRGIGDPGVSQIAIATIDPDRRVPEHLAPTLLHIVSCGTGRQLPNQLHQWLLRTARHRRAAIPDRYRTPIRPGMLALWGQGSTILAGAIWV